MPISMYSASIPVVTRMLTNLSACLDKAEASAKQRNYDSTVLVGSRLYPDMLPLSNQIQIACDAAKGLAARLAGFEIPKHEDNEKTIAELKARITKTLDFIKTVTPAQIDGSEKRAVSIPRRTKEPLQFDGETYMKHYALPNVFFHVTTAYAILRHNGVEIGKGDYLGAQ